MFSEQTALVVDGEFEIRKFVTNLLTTQLKFKKVAEAQSAEIALEMFKSGEKFDIIFSEWEMTRMKGDEFLSEIRKMPSTKKVPFIMMSYKKDKESLVQAIQAGVSNYIVKPITAGVFMQKVKKTMSDIQAKEVQSFKEKIKNPVDITVGEGVVLPGALMKITDANCVVRAPVFKRGTGVIYDTVSLDIKFEGSAIRCKAEIVGLSEDKVDVSIRQFVMVTFQFRELEKNIVAKIERLVTNFHVATLDEVKAPPKAPPES